MKRHDTAAYNEMEQGLLQVDKMVKGLAPGDPWIQLTGVLMRLAGKSAMPQLRERHIG